VNVRMKYSEAYPWFHNERKCCLPILSPGPFGTRKDKILSPEILNLIKPEEYIQRRYRETLSEVPHLKGETELKPEEEKSFT